MKQKKRRNTCVIATEKKWTRILKSSRSQTPRGSEQCQPGWRHARKAVEQKLRSMPTRLGWTVLLLSAHSSVIANDTGSQLSSRGLIEAESAEQQCSWLKARLEKLLVEKKKLGKPGKAGFDSLERARHSSGRVEFTESNSSTTNSEDRKKNRLEMARRRREWETKKCICAGVLPPKLTSPQSSADFTTSLGGACDDNVTSKDKIKLTLKGKLKWDGANLTRKERNVARKENRESLNHHKPESKFYLSSDPSKCRKSNEHLTKTGGRNVTLMQLKFHKV